MRTCVMLGIDVGGLTGYYHYAYSSTYMNFCIFAITCPIIVLCGYIARFSHSECLH